MSSKKSKDERLPDGWVLCCSKSNAGRKYYFNKKTGKSSWTQPEASGSDKKMNKKERNRLIEKKRKEEQSKKGSKRKSDGDQGQSPKRKKHECKLSKYHEVSHKRIEKCHTVSAETVSTAKLQNKISKSTPTKVAETPRKLKKNLANERLSQLRARLSNEAEAEELMNSQIKRRKASPNETLTKCKRDKSPSNDSKSNQSPNESLHSIPSPSQFFAANKIISSMKAQLPEEYCIKNKQKDTFADIEKGICSQTPEYPFSKHPATPPQFSEASKLVSAIKSKLAYKASTPKDSKTFTSAKDRLDTLKADLSTDLGSDHSLNNTNESFFNNSSQVNSSCGSEAMEIEEFREVRQNSPNKATSNDNNVVLVVDTNIFIHELDIIKDVLNSHLKGYREQPTLLVPWRVINELDRLKDNNNGNGAVCKRAKAAMDYLYKSLPENSRIKGQSLRDANSHIYPCEIPDDEILNCSLQQLERGNNVLLVTNDKNLRNKAQINSVRHIGIKELRDLLENKPQPAAAELYATFVRLRDATYPLLANILENEMRAKYDNLWQYVLFKEPPWTLADVLQCLLKHWIAVFNEVFPRIEHLITDLKRCLASVQNKDPNTVTQSEVTTFKELCLDVARRCQIIPEYMQLAKNCVELLLRDGASEAEDRIALSTSEIESGRSSCTSGSGVGARAMPNRVGASETGDAGRSHSASGTGDRLNRSSASETGVAGNSGASETNDRINHSRASEAGDTSDARTEAVVDAFESLWTVCSSYCAKLATSAGVAHNIEDRIPGDECLQHLSGKWNLFTGNIDAIARAIHGVLVADAASAEAALDDFEETFTAAVRSLGLQRAVGGHQLRVFCVDCRSMLREASGKFSQLSDLLVVCKNRLS